MNKPIIKSESELALMRQSGHILAEILHGLVPYVKPGVTTAEIDRKAEAAMARHQVAPSFKGYQGFPCVTCISINEEIVHTIPGKRTIQDGDIVTIDCGVIYKGWQSDSAITIMVGNVPQATKDFVRHVQKSLEKALEVIRPGAYTGDIGFTIQHYLEGKGYSIVRDFIGHGIGRAMHEPPEVPNFGKKGKGTLLVPGMTIAIEPIAAMGDRFADVLHDDWTAVTRDKSMACQIEHTVAITASGYEVFTQYNNTINNVYTQ
ncbi:type I methionyl aminopeptidase [Candidatus Peregrinibacteria bacterium CG11_big_fil_rev_8_21_14_0_20_46_8]|nr:MAG: type I methionyl aminopeptidase [Candidatus Peregrinibacteria bacterium CG11_big_fil_rev_8_21_14_0_20_46_8]